MPRVIADTSPIRYLIQIGEVPVLEVLFGSVGVPNVVAGELRHPSAPAAVRAWMKQPPGWVVLLPEAEFEDAKTNALDPGEASAIMQGLVLNAELILMDDRRGAAVAIQKGFEVVGTLGILDLAARRGLVDLRDAFERLKKTNFRYRQTMLDEILGRERA